MFESRGCEGDTRGIHRGDRSDDLAGAYFDAQPRRPHEVVDGDDADHSAIIVDDRHTVNLVPAHERFDIA